MKESPLSTNTRHIGHPVPRVDAGLKVTGQATYSAEYSEPGLLHGAVVLSTIAVGKIVSIDTTAAKAFPGVVEVFTHENRMDVATSDKKWQDDTAAPGHPFRPLDSDKILFDGQPVAFVVADRFETARDAAALVKVQYEAAEAHTDIEAERGNSYVPPTKRNGIAPPRSRAARQKKPMHRRPSRYRRITRWKANTTTQWKCLPPPFCGKVTSS